MLEVVEEGLTPVAIFNGTRSDGVNFILLWDELQNGGKEPPLLDSDLRGLALGEGKRCCKLCQSISWSIPPWKTLGGDRR